jgi:DNA polymerase V
MDANHFYSNEYKGSKSFHQQEVPTANATGFGSAADDYMERGIDLNEQLIKNKAATFFMRVQGNSMINASIHDGDVVIVDRSITAKSGHIIIAVINGDMLIRRLERTMQRVRLLPETTQLSPIDVTDQTDFSVWGVVTYIIKFVGNG